MQNEIKSCDLKNYSDLLKVNEVLQNKFKTQMKSIDDKYAPL